MNHFLLALLLLQPLSADSKEAKAIPHSINYQGYLTTNSGTAVTDTVHMTFAIFPSSTGGSPLWISPSISVPVINGIFHVTIENVPPVVFDGSERWLEIRINGAPLSPRQKISSVGYSYRSLNSDYSSVSERADTSNFAIRSRVSDSTGHALRADSSSYAENSGHAFSADTAFYAIHADTSTYAANASEADYATHADTATYAQNAGHAVNADTANFASSAEQANSALHSATSDTAAFAQSAGHAAVRTRRSTPPTLIWQPMRRTQGMR